MPECMGHVLAHVVHIVCMDLGGGVWREKGGNEHGNITARLDFEHTCLRYIMLIA